MSLWVCYSFLVREYNIVAQTELHRGFQVCRNSSSFGRPTLLVEHSQSERSIRKGPDPNGITERGEPHC